ncbi:SCO family protein [Haloterrigena alkaliphila]|uniref:SCO family protein n=1 Tax=Haloterrigena alkaliphila TaxID=2816475 RepID=UPI001CFF8689|nr:SCO family protein [Haloterrigena alkaliphila]UHQ95310.1 SCO family protein [Haloterrigena alkaliphila]
MERRTYLRSLGVAGLAGVAGCLESLGGLGGDSQTVLSQPDDYIPGASYPVHGDEFPSFSVPDPIAETTVSLEDFVGERPFLITYFFTTCPDGVCPALLLRLRWVQEDAAERGYEDDIGLLGFTFDPERDTPDVLSEYAAERGIDYEADNWHFLRPETYDEAETMTVDTFGIPLLRCDDEEEDCKTGDESGETGADDGETDTDGNATERHDEQNGTDDHEEQNGTESGGHDHGEYTFTHPAIITLVNEDGIVERAYPKAVQTKRAVGRDRILEDTRAVVGVE